MNKLPRFDVVPSERTALNPPWSVDSPDENQTSEQAMTDMILSAQRGNAALELVEEMAERACIFANFGLGSCDERQHLVAEDSRQRYCDHCRSRRIANGDAAELCKKSG